MLCFAIAMLEASFDMSRYSDTSKCYDVVHAQWIYIMPCLVIDMRQVVPCAWFLLCHLLVWMLYNWLSCKYIQCTDMACQASLQVVPGLFTCSVVLGRNLASPVSYGAQLELLCC